MRHQTLPEERQVLPPERTFAQILLTYTARYSSSEYLCLIQLFYLYVTRDVIRCRIFYLQFAVQNIRTKIYRTVTLPVVLYGCGTWSVTMREKHGLRVFEDRVLRKIFGLKRDEVTRAGRRLRKEERFDLYSSPNIIRVFK